MRWDLRHALERIGSPRLLVLGDLMLDRYVRGNADRVSQEAPILVLSADEQEERLGGAANVAHLLTALAADVTVAGLVGQDDDATCLVRLLSQSGADTSGILVDPTRRTTVKQRFVGRASGRHGGQVLRVDFEDAHALPDGLKKNWETVLADLIPRQDAILISDYAKGACPPDLIQVVLRAARQAQVPVYIDPSRHADYVSYAGAQLIKPNRYEAAHASGREITTRGDAFAAARALQVRYRIDNIVVTLDRDGMATLDRQGQEQHLASQALSVYDITGAGDMSFAALGLGLSSGMSLADAARIANVAAGWEVSQDGVAVMSRSQLAHELRATNDPLGTRVLDRQPLTNALHALRQQGKRIVFTNGCFDLLHVGHVSYLEEASRYGDVLVVAVNSDASVQRLKGPSRPIINANDRARMLASLACVDFVTVFDEPTPQTLLELLRPDVLVKGGTYRIEEVVGHEIVTAYGGEVRVTNVVDGVSTTKIVAMMNEHANVQPYRQAG